MEDDDLGYCCGACCLCCCVCVSKSICNLYTFLAAVAVAAVLIAAFAVALPVRATVTDASLARLDLITTHPNATSSPYSLAYNLSLTVVLRNRNWAMRAELSAPLDAELRFAGRRLGDGHGGGTTRLAGAGRRIPPRRSEEFRVLAVSAPRGVALGVDAAAEFERESAAGVFELELKLAGEVRYRPVHAGRSRKLEATCPVKMMMAPAARGTRLMVFDKVITCD
ncbi:unnamed protein product [Urochloa decumbens]|uniref:Late embryogenesis abundant protein LEA-2 subgroup domain-containing protein n=1 Tax=Urochloa decumbens TaxID=240449 RepID=A0ABC8ZV25_9POAL